MKIMCKQLLSAGQTVELLRLEFFPSGDLEITVEFLTEVDKLVQLIESPIFAYLRLELVRAESSGLRGALFGLLMLLPQSDAFHALRARLHCLPTHYPALDSNKVSCDDTSDGLDFSAMLVQFQRVQDEHRQYRMLDRSRDKLFDKGYSEPRLH